MHFSCGVLMGVALNFLLWAFALHKKINERQDKDPSYVIRSSETFKS